MSLLDMIPERDRAELRRNLFASDEFFDAVSRAVWNTRLGEDRLCQIRISETFALHGFAPSNPEHISGTQRTDQYRPFLIEQMAQEKAEHAAALRESLAEIERVIEELEADSTHALAEPQAKQSGIYPKKWAPAIRALAGPLRSAVERLRGLK